MQDLVDLLSKYARQFHSCAVDDPRVKPLSECQQIARQ